MKSNLHLYFEIQMIEEWVRTTFPHYVRPGSLRLGYIYRSLEKFLIENSGVDFSLDDTEYFLNLIKSDHDYGGDCLCLFLSNEIRVSNVIRLSDDDILNMISKAIYFKNHYLTINITPLIFEKIPLSQLNISDMWEESIFLKFLCCAYRNKNFEEIEILDDCFVCSDIIDPSKFISKIKEYLPFSKYLFAVELAMKCKNFQRYIENLLPTFLKRVVSLSAKTNVFLRIYGIQNELKSLSLPHQREFHFSIIAIKEIYTHFILKKFILPRIRGVE